jgi:hypothetical protein
VQGGRVKRNGPKESQPNCYVIYLIGSYSLSMRPPKYIYRKKILNKRKFGPLIFLEPVAKKNSFS